MFKVSRDKSKFHQKPQFFWYTPILLHFHKCVLLKICLRIIDDFFLFFFKHLYFQNLHMPLQACSFACSEKLVSQVSRISLSFDTTTNFCRLQKIILTRSAEVCAFQKLTKKSKSKIYVCDQICSYFVKPKQKPFCLNYFLYAV